MNSKDINLSVVIPYYNQPERVVEILEDMFNQQEINLEVIVVDDASENLCDDIISVYKSKGMNIQLIKHQTRSYTLKARLTGMQKAQGEYLAFADADDRLAGHDVYAKVYCEAKEKNCDILNYQTLAYDSNNILTTWDKARPFHKGILKDKEIFYTWLDKNCLPHSVWNKLYSKNVYEKVKNFQHSINIVRIEDFYLNTLFLFFAKSYASSKDFVYHYFPPKQMNHLEKSAARGIDCYRMYCDLPKQLVACGLEEEKAQIFKKVILIYLVFNMGRIFDYFEGSNYENLFDNHSENLEKILKYASKKEYTLAFLLINISNLKKIIDVNSYNLSI